MYVLCMYVVGAERNLISKWDNIKIDHWVWKSIQKSHSVWKKRFPLTQIYKAVSNTMLEFSIN